MNSRERVLTALDHQEPDRGPIDLGSTVVTSIAISTYAALREHLGLAHLPLRTLETVQQIADTIITAQERFLDAVGD